MAQWTGRCLCGDVTFAFDPGALIWQGHCHCKSCRRASGAAVVSWFGLHRDAWAWTGANPVAYQSSVHATRWHCGRCGNQMGYATTKLPDEMHGLAATLDDESLYAPQAHFYHAARLPWIHLGDALPRYVDGGKTLEG